MMISLVWSLGVVGLLANPANDPQNAGTVTWGKDFPGVNAIGLVELKGAFKAGDGWGIKDAWFDYVPTGGGVVSDKTKIAFAEGTWGASDVAGKILPAQAKLEPGEWNIRAMFVFEKKLPNGTTKTAEWQTSWQTIEVK